MKKREGSLSLYPAERQVVSIRNEICLCLAAKKKREAITCGGQEQKACDGGREAKKCSDVVMKCGIGYRTYVIIPYPEISILINLSENELKLKNGTEKDRVSVS